jgi:hypothetical protein
MVLWATAEAVILGESSLTAHRAPGSADLASTAGRLFLHTVQGVDLGATLEEVVGTGAIGQVLERPEAAATVAAGELGA